MKNLKFVSLLMVPMMLVGCKKITYQEPDFKKYSNKVEYSVFSEEINKIPLSSDKYTCFTSKYDSYLIKNTSTTNDKTKQTSKSQTENRSIANIQYDSVNTQLAVSMQIDNGSSQNGVALEQVSGESITNRSSAYQLTEEEIDGVKTFIVINPSKKTYYRISEVTEENNTAKYASNYVGIPSLQLGELLLKYKNSDDEEKKNYTFYFDKNLLTIKYSSQKNAERTALSNGELKKTANYMEVKEALLQIEAGKDKFSLSYKSSLNRKYQFVDKDDELNLYQGDVYTIKESNYVVSSLDYSIITIKPINHKQYLYIDYMDIELL